MKKSKKHKNSILHIEICGVIASGKSTIANMFEELGFTAVLEKFDINPFLRQFYENPEDHTFETEIAFLIQHYNQIKIAKKEKMPFACDFSLLLDLAFADVTLSGKEKKIFFTLYNEISDQVSAPNVIIHLQCNSEVLLERIHRRGRKVENTIDIDYLQKLDNALSNRVKEIEKKIKIINIDSEKYDFAENSLHRDQVKNLLNENIME